MSFLANGIAGAAIDTDLSLMTGAFDSSIAANILHGMAGTCISVQASLCSDY
jgi:hypothetical protein